MCVYLPLSLSTFYSLFLFAWLRGWTGGGGEKQLDGTNDVTNNNFSHTSSICGKQSIEILPVYPVTANTDLNKHFDKLTLIIYFPAFKIFDHETVVWIMSWARCS